MVELGWSTKRKLIYSGIVLSVFLVAISLLSLYFFYDEPTCFDGSKNQDELEIDCGGSCSKLCSSQISELQVLWAKAFKITDGFYNVAALIENPNINSTTNSVEYIFRLKNSFGEIITERKGQTFIPNTRIMTIFEPDFRLEEEVASVSFEFIGESLWQRNPQEIPEIDVKKKGLSQEDTSPRLEVRLENRSLKNMSRLEVVALIFDGKGEVIAVSRTFADDFRSGSSQDLVFTWPEAFTVEEKICQVPLDIALLLDRSGSMAADNLDPPEPLTQVKEAASFFVDSISDNDKISVVSFAAEASDPIDLVLTGDRNIVKEAIKNIQILFGEGIQYTNTSSALTQAFSELNSIRQRNKAEKIVILLTDGEKPNRPLKSGQENYPVILASSKALEIKEQGMEIFTIGLGEQFDGAFLQSISTSPEHYYNAPTSSDLKIIYQEIATKICKEGPATIDIITRELP